MARFTPLLTSLLVVGGFGFWPSAAPGESGAPASTTTPSAPAEPLTDAEDTIVAEATALFGDAGLELPDRFVASFHHDPADCAGNLGLSTIEAGTPRVRVCWSHEEPGVEARLQTQALVHELAHAWADHNLDDVTRAAFVEFTGSGSWNLRATDWQERGTERAADLITWALLDPAVLFVEFDGLGCHGWAAAYELLTGLDAPSPITETC